MLLKKAPAHVGAKAGDICGFICISSHLAVLSYVTVFVVLKIEIRILTEMLNNFMA